MCWIIYGALHGNVDENALNGINSRHDCALALGTKHDVKMAVLAQNWEYRVTDGYCDCDSPIGAGDPEAPDVTDFASLIREACALPGADTVSFCKAWDGERNKRERAVKLSQTDLPRLLADLEPRTLYTVTSKT